MTSEPSKIPAVLRRDGPIVFPDARHADEDGLVAVGGDLSVERLLAAYSRGIFPCYGDDTPPLWWSPEPRAVIDPEHLHVSRRLSRRLRQGRFRTTWDRSFRPVMAGCGEGREDGRWILPEMTEAYARLQHRGAAHSLEVWDGAALVGGLYGVRIGALFAAESMFHRVTDASKVALATAVPALFAAGIEMFDVQYLTDHLESMGAYEITRDEYLTRAARAAARSIPFTLPVGPEPAD